MTGNLFLLDISISNIYLVDTYLLPRGPGKNVGLEDNTSTFEDLHSKMIALNKDGSNNSK